MKPHRCRPPRPWFWKRDRLGATLWTCPDCPKLFELRVLYSVNGDFVYWREFNGDPLMWHQAVLSGAR